MKSRMRHQGTSGLRMTLDSFTKPIPPSIGAAIARLRAEMDADDADARDARLWQAVRHSDAWRRNGSSRERLES